MSSFIQHPLQDSDSDDDDYVPTAEADSDDEAEEHHEKPETPIETIAEDESAKKKAREALWADFQASVSTPPVQEPQNKNMIKVEKRYLFAGKEVAEVIEVTDDSPEAKKWPLWRPPGENDLEVPVLSTSPLASSTITAGPSTLVTSQTPVETRPPPGKRPGPRKPKTSLSAIPQKPKKLSTLDKSAMDWNTHINAQPESGVKDELEANRRGGGYLEKVEFLKRVDERKEDVIEANKPSKRRKL